MGTDRYAYCSPLRRMDPLGKGFVSLLASVVCLCCGTAAVGLFTMLLMGGLTILWGGQKLRTFGHFMKIPLAFLAIGSLTMVVQAYPPESALLVGIPVGDMLWGVDRAGLWEGASMFCRALGVVASMYFLALTTPVVDLTQGLRRLHVPALMVELMELIYRFIFTLTNGADRIRVAQKSRLGYGTARRTIDDAGVLASMVFLRAWRQGNRVYAALESRGYTGTLATLSRDYESGRPCFLAAAGVCAAQLGMFALERWLF